MLAVDSLRQRSSLMPTHVAHAAGGGGDRSTSTSMLALGGGGRVRPAVRVVVAVVVAVALLLAASYAMQSSDSSPMSSSSSSSSSLSSSSSWLVDTGDDAGADAIAGCPSANHAKELLVQKQTYEFPAHAVYPGRQFFARCVDDGTQPTNKLQEAARRSGARIGHGALCPFGLYRHRDVDDDNGGGGGGGGGGGDDGDDDDDRAIVRRHDDDTPCFCMQSPHTPQVLAPDKRERRPGGAPFLDYLLYMRASSHKQRRKNNGNRTIVLAHSFFDRIVEPLTRREWHMSESEESDLGGDGGDTAALAAVTSSERLARAAACEPLDPDDAQRRGRLIWHPPSLASRRFANGPFPIDVMLSSLVHLRASAAASGRTFHVDPSPLSGGGGGDAATASAAWSALCRAQNLACLFDLGEVCTLPDAVLRAPPADTARCQNPLQMMNTDDCAELHLYGVVDEHAFVAHDAPADTVPPIGRVLATFAAREWPGALSAAAWLRNAVSPHDFVFSGLHAFRALMRLRHADDAYAAFVVPDGITAQLRRKPTAQCDELGFAWDDAARGLLGAIRASRMLRSLPEVRVFLLSYAVSVDEEQVAMACANRALDRVRTALRTSSSAAARRHAPDIEWLTPLRRVDEIATKLDTQPLYADALLRTYALLTAGGARAIAGVTSGRLGALALLLAIGTMHTGAVPAAFFGPVLGAGLDEQNAVAHLLQLVGDWPLPGVYSFCFDR